MQGHPASGQVGGVLVSVSARSRSRASTNHLHAYGWVDGGEEASDKNVRGCRVTRPVRTHHPSRSAAWHVCVCLSLSLYLSLSLSLYIYIYIYTHTHSVTYIWRCSAGPAPQQRPGLLAGAGPGRPLHAGRRADGARRFRVRPPTPSFGLVKA